MSMMQGCHGWASEEGKNTGVSCHPGCAQIPEAAEAAAAIDGEDGVHWHLPLPPLNGQTLFEPYSPGAVSHNDVFPSVFVCTERSLCKKAHNALSCSGVRTH